MKKLLIATANAGKLKEISGKEVDEFKADFDFYSKKVKEIREKLEIRMQEHLVDNLHCEMEKLLKNIFGNKSQNALLDSLDKELVKKGKLQPRMLEIAKEILKIKQKAKNSVAMTILPFNNSVDLDLSRRIMSKETIFDVAKEFSANGGTSLSSPVDFLLKNCKNLILNKGKKRNR